jgi:hypothetical protein
MKIAMGKSTKTQRLREKVRADIKRFKQTTLDNLPESNITKQTNGKIEQKKQVEFSELSTSIREDQLTLIIGFNLHPSRTVFSKLVSDLYFDAQKMDSRRLRILPGPLASNNLEFSFALDMTGISPGKHTVKVELCELWSSEEKLNCTFKEVTIDYVPVKREDRLVRVPIVKRVVGADLVIVSEKEKNIYREMEDSAKKETVSKRDGW